MSRIQNEYGSDNPQENSGLPEKPYSKQIQYNDLNNNNVVVVEDGQPDKKTGLEGLADTEIIPQINPHQKRVKENSILKYIPGSILAALDGEILGYY